MAKEIPKSAVFGYFKLSEDEHWYHCQCQIMVENEKKACGAPISAFRGNDVSKPSRTYNLKRHLLRHHPNIHEEVLKKDSENEKLASTSSKKHKLTETKQSAIRQFFTNDKMTITMTEKKFRQSIIGMVVHDNVAIQFFSKPSFKGLNGEIAQKLGVSLERENIRAMVIGEANSKKEELKRILKNRFIFVKVDACTRHRVNYLAINVRFVAENGKAITKTLAVKDTEAHHAGDYLKCMLQEVFTEFGIVKERILCIITDNAANMISMMKCINQNNENLSDESEDSAEDDDVQPTDDLIEEKCYKDPNESFLTELESSVEQASRKIEVEHMRCAAHTLQLAVRDGLKDKEADKLIRRLRKIAVAARVPKTDAIIKRKAKKGAILDQATRWGSTYMMIQRLIELRPILDDLDNESVMMNQSQWDKAENLVNILKLPYLITKKMQAEDLTPGQFFHDWKNLVFDLKKNGRAYS
ncbi:uncharacterized protein LOC120422101 [Culex pipiens pallens]|uniref:uncharacterized protein LOC120422101 n=1 Tax=Culex pipiens pallens TaxID=42434 RepID=UPI001953AA38|nr:uncharacterized protein LOC120422101 [Culex pipiens pallens]